MTADKEKYLELQERITDYLGSGGLFNPEMAKHDAVRDLLIECRDALARAAAVAKEARVETIEKLKEHWLFNIECHHQAKTDQAVCACGWKSPERESVGKAVESWANHALEQS